jgi:hypothetical protein
MIKLAKPVVTGPITSLIKSIETTIFPDQLKVAQVKPYKFSILIAINCETNNQKPLIGPSVWQPHLLSSRAFFQSSIIFKRAVVMVVGFTTTFAINAYHH